MGAYVVSFGTRQGFPALTTLESRPHSGLVDALVVAASGTQNGGRNAKRRRSGRPTDGFVAPGSADV